MYFVTEEKKSWRCGSFDCHGRMIYVYQLKVEFEKRIFQKGVCLNTIEEVLTYLEKEWER